MEKQRRRRRSPLPYLLLNVIVSALTTLLVLWLWSRAQDSKLPEQIDIPPNNPSAEQVLQLEPTSTPLPPLPSLDSAAIQIVNLFGLGDVENELIILQNIKEDEEIWLNGWNLIDEDGNKYLFQSLVLNPGAQIQVNTRAGYDSVTQLFWNRNEPVWQSGETATLIDYAGNIRATYIIP